MIRGARLPGACAAATVLALALAGCGGQREGGTPAEPGTEAPADAGGLAPATLFFPAEGGILVKEERPLPGGLPEERIRAIVAALLEGPAVAGARAALPEDATLESVYLGREGVAYLDFHRPEGKAPPPMGSLQEILMVYSLVNSVALNVQEVDRVSLLWNGVQRPSLAGHLDNGGPLAPRPRLAP